MPRDLIPVASPLLCAVLALAAHAGHGELDDAFNGVGTVLGTPGSDALAQAVAIQADGKIIIAGSADGDAALVRYGADGVLDASFGDGGIVRTTVGDGVALLDVAVQADGKIVGVGTAQPDTDLLVLRYDAGGELDPTFGDGGVVLHSVGTARGRALAIQPDGKIVAAGSFDGMFLLARFLEDGALDTTFGDGDGLAVTDGGPGFEDIFGVAMAPDDKIVIAGFTWDAAPDIAVARYTSAGVADASFGTDGIVVAEIGSRTEIAYDVAVQADGRILVAGTAETVTRGKFDADHLVARFDVDGSLDATFGNGTGVVTTGLHGTGAATEEFRALAVQPDGKIVAAGFGGEFPNFDFVLARYTADGLADVDFDGDGLIRRPSSPTRDELRGLAIQADGKIVAAGRVESSGDGMFFGARYSVAPTCSPAPSASCSTGFAKAAVTISEKRLGAEKLVVKLASGPAATQADLGDPTVLLGTQYTACFYDDGEALVGSIRLDDAGGTCEASPCWRAAGSKGYVYKDRGRESDGIVVAKLLGTPTQILIKGKNSAKKQMVDLPVGMAARLASSSNVTVEILGSDTAACFASTLTTIVKQTASTLKIRR